MKQGVLFAQRKFLLLGKHKGFYRPKRDGCRKRKAVRGCIIGPDISVVNVIVQTRGKTPIEGVTDVLIPRPLAPRRASKIRKLFNLTKEDDVRQYVIPRKTKRPGKATVTKIPKIQRLVTPALKRRERKRVQTKLEGRKRTAALAADYKKLLATLSAARRAAAPKK